MGVLCRYFFQQMLVEGEDRPLDEFTSSLMLSSHPTLSELRGASRYYWRDLRDEKQVLAVAKNGEFLVKVLQLEGRKEEDEVKLETRTDKDLVDVPEDEQFGAFFQWQSQAQSEELTGFPMPQPQKHDVGSVFVGVKKALLASKVKSSAMAQTLQKHSAQMWEKVTAAASGGGDRHASPTAPALAQLAKLIGAMKTPLHPGNREHVDMLQRLWTSCFDIQPITVPSSEWNRLGFRHGDLVREIQFLLPLQCLVFFHEVHHTVALPILNDQNRPEVYPYALVGSQIAYLLADLLQLRDGGCLGLERPFWKLFEDPMAFYELFCIAFRAFDASWKLNSTTTADVSSHLSYVGDFAQELLRRGPENVLNLIEHANHLQNW